MHALLPPCPWYGTCGGCSMQHMAYERALAQKRKRVADCLARIGGFAPDSYLLGDAVGMANPFRYRNKAVAPSDGERIGFYRANSTDVVPVDDCLLQHESFAPALAATRENMEADIRSLLFRVSSHGGGMTAVNTRADAFHNARRWTCASRDALPALQCALHGRNAVKDKMGSTFHALWGSSDLKDDWLGIRARVSPASFRQVNYIQAEKLYTLALSLVNPQGNERVVDAYCGAGILTQLLAQRCASVVGIELSSTAIAEARQAAQESGLANLRFLHGTCEALLPGESCDLLVLDPPRRGADERVLAAALDARPASIVYISCDPATLSRDIKRLAQGGYRLEQAVPVDMFPWTAHVETITRMVRNV